MDTNHNREDQPRGINPDETGKTHPSKILKSQKKIDINESGLGREQGQFPADENIDRSLSQIDKDTIKVHDDRSTEIDIKKDNPHNQSHASEINDTDLRDQRDSTTDWDAESSKTGRHK